jgi:ABC-2 type transport system permease protein
MRGVTKLMRDRPRLAVNLAFPVLLIGGLGSILEPTVGRVTGLNAATLAFTGVLAASLFQSAAAGMISIVEDRETDFSRELFVTPVSRLTLVTGKVAGETLVAFCQGIFIVGFAVVFGVRMSPGQLGGVLVPIRGTAFYLNVAAHLMPMRYVVELTRAAYYAGTPGYRRAVSGSPLPDAVVAGALFVILMITGAAVFGYRERTR